MILRFMDVDFSLLPGLAASSKSRIGNDDRVSLSLAAGAAAGIPLLKGGSTDWEGGSSVFPELFAYPAGCGIAWYNAGSAFLILIILLSVVALYFYFRGRARIRRRGGNLFRDDGDAAERVPLDSQRVELDNIERAEEYELDENGRKRRVDRRFRKGKGRASERDDERESVFALGEDEDR